MIYLTILNRDFAAMLRNEPNCFTFTIENTTMLCKGHPEWDPKKPGKNVEVRALRIDTRNLWSIVRDAHVQSMVICGRFEMICFVRGLYSRAVFAMQFRRASSKLSKSGTIITKISEKQRKGKWLKSGMIQFVQRQSFEINK